MVLVSRELESQLNLRIQEVTRLSGEQEPQLRGTITRLESQVQELNSRLEQRLPADDETELRRTNSLLESRIQELTRLSGEQESQLNSRIQEVTRLSGEQESQLRDTIRELESERRMNSRYVKGLESLVNGFRVEVSEGDDADSLYSRKVGVLENLLIDLKEKFGIEDVNSILPYIERLVEEYRLTKELFIERLRSTVGTDGIETLQDLVSRYFEFLLNEITSQDNQLQYRDNLLRSIAGEEGSTTRLTEAEVQTIVNIENI